MRFRRWTPTVRPGSRRRLLSRPLIYQMVDKTRDRRGPRRQAHRRHRRHRLPRHRARRAPAAVGARLRARPARPARASGRRVDPAGPARDLPQRRLRPPARRPGQGRRSTPRSPAGSRSVAGDVGTDGLGLDDDGRAALAVVRHRHPLGRHRGVRLAARRRRRGQPARPHPHRRRRSHDLGVTPHLVAVSTCYVAGNRRGAAPEEPRRREPVLRRRRLAGARSTPPAGPGADAEAESRTPEPLAALPQARPARELGAAGTPAAGRRRPSSAARRGSPTAWSRPAGPAPRSLGWPDAYAYTKALGERALLEQPRRRAGDDRAPVDHRVGAGRAPARLDPRLPHGRAGDHLLRPRPAEGVPRRPRGHRRRHPRRPRRRPPSAPSPPAGPARRARRSSRSASGSANPLRYRASSTSCRPGSPSTRSTTATASPSSCPSGRSPAGAGCRASSTRAKTRSSAAETVLQSLPLRGKQAEWSATLEEKREEADRALGYVELYGAYAECEAIYGVDRLLALCERARRRRPGARSASTPGSSTGPRYVHDVHLPSVVEHARVRTDAPAGAPARPARDRLRRQVLSPDRQLAAFDLENTLIASNVVASYSWLATRRLPPRRPAPLRRQDAGRGARRCWRSTGATAATSSATSTAATRAPRSTSSTTTPPRCSATCILTKSFPAGIRRVREHRAPRPPHRAHHRRARLRRRAAAAAVRRHRVRPARHVDADGTYTGELTDAPPTGEARAPALARLRRRQRLRPGRGGRLRRLDQRPADARGGRLPGRGEPRDPPGRPRPQAGLAGRALRQGRRRPQPPLPIGPAWPRRGCSVPDVAGTTSAARAAAEAGDEGPRLRAQAGPLRGRRGRRAAAARARRAASARCRCATSTRPTCPGAGWVRLRPRLAGICGSDLATIDGQSSRYFEPIVSFPFTPGHEVVGDLDDGTPGRARARPRAARPAASTRRARSAPPGASTAASASRSATSSPACRPGSAADTGGGWSTAMVAHRASCSPCPTT